MGRLLLDGVKEERTCDIVLFIVSDKHSFLRPHRSILVLETTVHNSQISRQLALQLSPSSAKGPMSRIGGFS